MKIAVTAAGSTLCAVVDPRFGLCPYFVLVETGPRIAHVMPNPHQASGSTAGTACAQLLVNQNVDVLLTGQCAPEAATVLANAGVEVVIVRAGTVAEVVNRFLAARQSAV